MDISSAVKVGFFVLISGLAVSVPVFANKIIPQEKHRVVAVARPPVVVVPQVEDLLPRKSTRQQQARFAHFVGITMEVFGKNAPNGWYTKPFFAALQNAGVQLQVAALNDLGLISREPNKAFIQGLLIGL